MQLLAPDILEEARRLPAWITGSGLAIGLFLWLLGAWSHRFWLALALTLIAGLVGLTYGPMYGMQRLVAGLLLAVATGALALALVRILVFAAGGLAGLCLAQTVVPGWDEQLVCFLVGGLIGVLLYRFWITLMASLIGTLLMSYSALCLADKTGKIDMVTWTNRNGPLLNWGCATLTVVGLVVQFLLDRRRRRKQRRTAVQLQEEARERQMPFVYRQPAPRSAWTNWWRGGPKADQRRAG